MRRARLYWLLGISAAAVAVGAVPLLRRATLEAIAPTPVCEEVDRFARLERQINEAMPNDRGLSATPVQRSPSETEVVASLEVQPDGSAVVRVGSESISLRHAAEPGNEAEREQARTAIAAAISKAAKSRESPTGRIAYSGRGRVEDVVLVTDAFAAAGVREVAFFRTQ